MTSATVLVLQTTHTAIGGVQSRQARLADALCQRGWRVVFGLTWGNRFHRPADFERFYGDYEQILLDGRSGTADGRRLSIEKAIRRIRPAVLMPGPLMDAFEVARALKKQQRSPRVVYGLPGIHAGAFAYLRRYAGIIDQAFGVSALTVELLKHVIGVPRERIHYIPTGVADAHTIAQRNNDGPFRLGYVGRIDPDKRPLDLIDLCSELDHRSLDYQFTVVGGGSLADELRSRAASWITSGKLCLRGSMSPQELYRHVYPHLDACLLFSQHEGMPNTLLEAMMHGVVPVTSDFSGRRQENLIRDNETGLVFPVGAMAVAAEQISRLHADRQWHDQLAKSAREAVASTHSLQSMADAFYRLLEQTVATPCRNEITIPVEKRVSGRLSRWAGPTLAEHVRKLLGRRFLHPDASEWPLIDNYWGPDVSEVASLTKNQLEDSAYHLQAFAPSTGR